MVTWIQVAGWREGVLVDQEDSDSLLEMRMIVE